MLYPHKVRLGASTELGMAISPRMARRQFVRRPLDMNRRATNTRNLTTSEDILRPPRAR
jgi:hypothetical protein